LQAAKTLFFGQKIDNIELAVTKIERKREISDLAGDQIQTKDKPLRSRKV